MYFTQTGETKKELDADVLNHVPPVPQIFPHRRSPREAKPRKARKPAPPDAEGDWKFSLRTSIGPTPEIHMNRKDGQYRIRWGLSPQRLAEPSSHQAHSLRRKHGENEDTKPRSEWECGARRLHSRSICSTSHQLFHLHLGVFKFRPLPRLRIDKHHRTIEQSKCLRILNDAWCQPTSHSLRVPVPPHTPC